MPWIEWVVNDAAKKSTFVGIKKRHLYCLLPIFWDRTLNLTWKSPLADKDEKLRSGRQKRALSSES